MKKILFILCILILVNLTLASYFLLSKSDRVAIDQEVASQQESLSAQILPETETKPPKKISLMFVGDMMLSRGVANKMKKENDYKSVISIGGL